MVVHGLDGLDEVSTIGNTAIAHLRGGEVTELEVSPEDFDVKTARVEDLTVPTLQESAETLFKILSGNLTHGDPKMEFVLVNSVAGIMVGGKADDFEGGMDLACESIDSGMAYGKLKAFIKASGGNMSKIEELEMKYE